jgi:transposase
MASSTMVCAGIDIGKARLDVALVPTNEALCLANGAEGHRELVAWLQRQGVARVGLEASGGYERDVLEALIDAGFEAVLLQPGQVRAYARYRLQHAKNDRIDAALIARVTAELETVRGPRDPRLTPLAEHLRLIEQIEADLACMKTRAEAYREPRLRRWIAQETSRLEKRLKLELALLQKALCRHQDLQRRLMLVESVEGIGRRTALTLVILMPELGSLDRAKIASLAGLAPFDRDSGKHSGLRRIHGGRHRVRKALFAAALAASFRWNKGLVALYKRLRGRGKPHKQALVACARKLLIFANTVLARDAEWVPAR